MRKAIFLDRDGTINVDVSYLHEIEKVEFLPGAIEALRLLKEKGYLLIVVSNQSGVGRGYFSLEDVQRINDYMNECLLEKHAQIDAFYYCPHTPEEKCQCRKPGIELYLKAADTFQIDFHNSYMVGDKESDILPAQILGCGYGLLWFLQKLYK